MAEEQLKLEAQEALDELWLEGRLRFRLTAYTVERVGVNCRIDFFDSRVPPLLVFWNPQKGSFKTAVRSEVERTILRRRT